jgi:hypothetical protein
MMSGSPSNDAFAAFSQGQADFAVNRGQHRVPEMTNAGPLGPAFVI